MGGRYILHSVSSVPIINNRNQHFIKNSIKSNHHTLLLMLGMIKPDNFKERIEFLCRLTV